MAVGKNKKLGKGKKGGRKKVSDPFHKKEWYEVRAPAVFPVPTKSIGRTVVTKTQGTKIARDSLINRVFEVSLGDLKANAEDDAFRKFSLRVEDVNGQNCLTQFHGMDLTTDKLRSLVRKLQSLIEAHVDVRTTDGYALRLFAIAFTRKQKDQRRKASYTQTSQTKAIRRRMIEIMAKEASSCDLNQLVEKLMTESIGREIEKHGGAIYPLANCIIRKVKMIRSPKVDVTKLLEAHGGAEALKAADATAAAAAASSAAGAAKTEDVGTKVDGAAKDEKKDHKDHKDHKGGEHTKEHK